MLVRLAVGLVPHGFAGPAGMTPGEVLFASRVVGEQDRRGMQRNAVAAALGQDGKALQKELKEG